MTEKKKETKDKSKKIVSINDISKKEKKPEVIKDKKPEVIKDEKPKLIKDKKETRGRPKKIKLDVKSRKDIKDEILPEKQGWSRGQKVGFWAGVTLTVLGIGILLYKMKLAMDKARLEDEKEDLENEKEGLENKRKGDIDEEFIDEKDLE